MSGDITGLLAAWSAGRGGALDELMAHIHRELRQIARLQLKRERADHTLQPSALVNEAFLRLMKQNRVAWECRSHFFAVAATTMRRILVDYARRRRAEKRGADPERVSWGEVQLAIEPGVDLLDLEIALEHLEALDARQARIVELRVFAGCTVEETGQAVGASPATVKREWRAAQVWLRGELQGPADRPE